MLRHKGNRVDAVFEYRNVNDLLQNRPIAMLNNFLYLNVNELAHTY